MDESIIFVGLEPGEIIDHENGRATYKGFNYTRKRTAYIKRARDICDHSFDQWMDLCAEYDFTCCKCGCEVLGGIPTKDHIIGITIGGTSSIKNIQPLCRGCNISKGPSIRDYR